MLTAWWASFGFVRVGFHPVVGFYKLVFLYVRVVVIHGGDCCSVEWYFYGVWVGENVSVAVGGH